MGRLHSEHCHWHCIAPGGYEIARVDDFWHAQSKIVNPCYFIATRGKALEYRRPRPMEASAQRRRPMAMETSAQASAIKWLEWLECNWLRVSRVRPCPRLTCSNLICLINNINIKYRYTYNKLLYVYLYLIFTYTFRCIVFPGSFWRHKNYISTIGELFPKYITSSYILTSSVLPLAL